MDSMAILQGSVGLLDCTPHICDVNDTGAVTAADALLTLRVSVGTPGYALDCRDCATVDGVAECSCTGEDLVERLNTLGTGKKLAKAVGVLFDCEGTEGSPTVISVTDETGLANSWDSADTVIEQSDIWITGMDEYVQIELDPPCDRRCLGRCTGCSTNGDCATGKTCSSNFCNCSANTDCITGGTCVSGSCVADCTQDDDCSGSFICKGTGGRSDVPDPVECAGACANNGDCATFGGGQCSNGACTSQCSTVGVNKCSSGHYLPGGSQYNSTYTQCPNIDAGQRFLKLNGANITVAGITVRGFFDGVHFGDSNGTVRDSHFQRQCDDSITNLAGEGTGSMVQTSLITEHCDKGVQDYAGGEVDAGCTPTDDDRDCWHITYDDVDFLGCKLALRVAGDDTRIRVMNSTVGNFGTGSSHLDYWCQEPRFDGADVVSFIDNTTVDSCESAWIFGGARSQHALHDSLITDSKDRGVDARGTGGGADIGATVETLRGRIVDNGGFNGSSPLGGLTVSNEGFMEIGDGTSNNANKICGNTKGDGGRRQVNDVRAGGSMIIAEQNYWGQSTGPVQTCSSNTDCDIVGNVDFSPHRTTDPFSGTACQ
ncbi:MAG TPA: hypothetical protein VEL28_04765 [Candidatus Binatia bacterium]|nr:hypothetical protein [Candidatus Binatia bacterium]